MKILFIEVSTVEHEGSVPFGTLYVASDCFRRGHDVKILDLVKENLTDERVVELTGEFAPQLVGVGGITAGYGHCKRVCMAIKKKYPHIKIVVGGVIASAADLLLQKVGVDFVVHGEGEMTLQDVIKAMESNETNYGTIQGISYLKEGIVYKNPAREQISKQILDDEVPFPEYKLLDMSLYFDSAEEWVKFYFAMEPETKKDLLFKLKGKRILPIITARGCPYKCIFCYRHLVSWRQHTVEYIVKMMRQLRDDYQVGIFCINDELTTLDRKWVLNFADTLIRENLGVYFIVLSARVDNMDEEMLIKLKQAGCVMINYGYESGSNTVLKEIDKKATREQALITGKMTKRLGLKNIPEIIIGFPSETEETIEETIDFLKQINQWPISLNTPMPFPETPLWRIADQKNLIGDKEEFVLGCKRFRFINFTNMPDTTLRRLVKKAHFEVLLHWLWGRKDYISFTQYWIKWRVMDLLIAVLPMNVYENLKQQYRNIKKVLAHVLEKIIYRPKVVIFGSNT